MAAPPSRSRGDRRRRRGRSLTRGLAACLALVLTARTSTHGAPQAPDRELAQGVRLAKEGDFEGALLALDAVAQRLARSPERSKELAQTYLYIGVAYVGLGQAPLARTKFRQALGLDPALRLAAEEFPPRVIRAFEAAQQELAQEATLHKEAKKKRGKGGLILLGVGGLAAGGIAIAVTGERKNRPPTATVAITPDGQGLAGATRLTFTANGSDPDGEPLSYSWNFGDGASGEGMIVNHVYNQAASYSVVLTVRDGLTSTTVPASVTVRSLSGRWRPMGPMLKDEVDLELVHSGTAVSTAPTFSDGSRGSSSSPNGVQDPRGVTLRYLDPREAVGGVFSCNYSFVGQADSAIQTIPGTARCEGSVNCPCLGQVRAVTLVRQ